MRWIKRIIAPSLAILGVLVGLLVAETALRISGIGYGSGPIEASKVLHHVHPKDYQFSVHEPGGEFGGHTIIYDEFRYRIGEKKLLIGKQDKTVYFLGDSFTEAVQVSWSDSFVGKISSRNQVNVRNMGVSSYSPIQYLIQLRRELSKLNDVDVVIQLFENDFVDDSMYRLKANSLDPIMIESIDGGASSTMILLLRYSYLVRLVRKVQLQLYFIMDRSSHADSPTTGERIDERYPINKRIFSYELLLEIKNQTDLKNIRLHLMIIPSKTLSQINRCCAEDWLSDEVKAFAVKNGISFIDLARDFQNVSNQKALFFTRDIHLTPVGHEVVATSIENHLFLGK